MEMVCYEQDMGDGDRYCAEELRNWIRAAYVFTVTSGLVATDSTRISLAEYEHEHECKLERGRR